MTSHPVTPRYPAPVLAIVLLAALLLSAGAFAQTAAAIADATAPPPSAGASSAPAAAAASDSYLSEPGVVRRSVNWIVNRFGEGGGARGSGFYPELSNMRTGAGWVSAGPGYRQYFLGNRMFVDGSAAVSWHLYKMAQARVEWLPSDRLTVGAQSMWQDQTQVNYFGPGPDSLEESRSQYRIKTTDVVGYASLRTNDWLSIDGRFGWLHQPELDSPGGSFIPDLPNTLVAFAGEPGVGGRQPEFLHSEIAVTADTRDYRNHPTSGAVYRAAVMTYWDQDGGHFGFNEYQADGLQIVPLIGTRWLLALHGSLVLTDADAEHDIPIYLQPSLGGNNTLRDFHSYRFHDDNALVANAESRWALFEHVDLAAFFDAGNVAARAGDLNFDKTSYGAGLRLHTTRMTLARLDVANGAEGWRVLFRTTEPFRLARASRRIADVPFAP